MNRKSIWTGFLVALVMVSVSAAALGSGVSIEPSADTSTDERIPYRNYGSANTLMAYNSPGPMDRYIWLKFEIPEDAEINKATLKLKYMYSRAVGGDAVYGVFNCTDDAWTEKELTWRNQPTFGEEALDTAVAEGWAYNGDPLEFDVTSEVNTQVDDGDYTITFVVKSMEDAHCDYIQAFSKEQPGYEPCLEIE